LVDFSQTSKMKVYKPKETEAPAQPGASDFGGITLNLDETNPPP